MLQRWTSELLQRAQSEIFGEQRTSREQGLPAKMRCDNSPWFYKAKNYYFCWFHQLRQQCHPHGLHTARCTGLATNAILSLNNPNVLIFNTFTKKRKRFVFNTCYKIANVMFSN